MNLIIIGMNLILNNKYNKIIFNLVFFIRNNIIIMFCLKFVVIEIYLILYYLKKVE